MNLLSWFRSNIPLSESDRLKKDIKSRVLAQQAYNDYKRKNPLNLTETVEHYRKRLKEQVQLIDTCDFWTNDFKSTPRGQQIIAEYKYKKVYELYEVFQNQVNDWRSKQIQNPDFFTGSLNDDTKAF